MLGSKHLLLHARDHTYVDSFVSVCGLLIDEGFLCSVQESLDYTATWNSIMLQTSVSPLIFLYKRVIPQFSAGHASDLQGNVKEVKAGLCTPCQIAVQVVTYLRRSLYSSRRDHSSDMYTDLTLLASIGICQHTCARYTSADQCK